MSAKIKRARVDKILVERGLVIDSHEAQVLVMAGEVIANDQRVQKPSDLVPVDATIRLQTERNFVSRGGDKLMHALEAFGLVNQLKDAVVLDIGASTGGFTHCCLQLGAKQVIAVDVGTNQLAWKLRNDPRVVSIERTDVRDLDLQGFPKIDFVMVDVSFTSLARLAAAIRNLAPGQGVHFLMLVKPQFELPSQKIPDGGVVFDEEHRQQALTLVREAFLKLGIPTGKAVDSAVPGRQGNREIFYWITT